MIHPYYRYTNEAETSIVVAFPSTGSNPRPTAILIGDQTANTCNGLYEANGQDSIGRLRRNLEYEWWVNNSLIIGTNEILTVPEFRYANLESFTLSLVVINFLGERSLPVV